MNLTNLIERENSIMAEQTGDLFNIAGVTQSGTEVARDLVTKLGQDPLTRARDAASRGNLGSAAEFLTASSLSKDQKIDELNKLSEQAMRYFQDHPDTTGTFSNRAVATFQATKKALEQKQD